MDKSLKLFRVPGELDYLTHERPSAESQRPRQVEYRSHNDKPVPALSRAASQRVLALADLEQESGPSVAHPGWLGGQAIPRLIVLARYAGQDAYGSSRLLADLDIATRRAGALMNRLTWPDKSDRWPRPMRTYQGGLHLLDARVGSFDIAMTVWGSLVTWATSSPIAVAGMLALAWDVGRGGIRLANRWLAAAQAEGQDYRPSLEAPSDAEPWGARLTKELAPTMQAAAANGQGFEYYLDESDRTVKLVVPPKAE